MALCGTSQEMKQILDALGLKGKGVVSFKLEAAVDSVVKLTVQFIPDYIDGEKIATVFRKYKLEEIEKE